MNSKARAEDYIKILCKNVGFNSVSIFENEDKDLIGSFIPEDEFFKQIENAFMAGYAIAKEKCDEKSCINCDYYNGISFYMGADDRPQISCRRGGLQDGFEPCRDYENVDYSKDNEPF